MKEQEKIEREAISEISKEILNKYADDILNESLNKLHQYLDSISEEQFTNEWNEIKKMGFDGPSVEDFFKTLNITPTISSNTKNCRF